MDFSKISSQRFFVIWVCTSSKGKYTPAVLLSRFVHSRRKISPSSLRILSHTGHFRESCLPPRLPPVSSPWSRRTSDGSHSAPTRALPVASGKLSRHVQMVKSALNSHKSFCSCSMKTKVRMVCGLRKSSAAYQHEGVEKGYKWGIRRGLSLTPIEAKPASSLA